MSTLKKNKIPKFSKVDAFFTVKDHKKDFPLNIECRTINPSKNSLGKISKNILENIVTQIKKKTTIIQWRNTYEVTKWFDQIDEKLSKCFVNFDIQKFYLSIKLIQLKNAKEFARKFTDTSEEDTNIIIYTCNSVLTYNGKIWTKTKTQLLMSLWGHISVLIYAT